MPIFSSVNIISKWSWCPVFRCFVQTKLFELDGSSCFSFISRAGWYSLMRPRRFLSRFFSDIEKISRNSTSVSLLFFYLSILFLLSMLSLRLCVVNCSVTVEVFRSPGSRGLRSDLVLVPLFRFFAFHLSFLFLFYFIGATTFQLLSCTLWYKTHK